MRPFISEQLGLEAILDVQPAGILLGGRGGRTAEGVRIYSESDNISDKMEKSFMHLMNAVEPGVVSTFQKIHGGASRDLSKSGQPIYLKDELIALLSGIRVININVLKSMEYKTGEFQRLLRAVDDTEKIYSAADFQDRGPEVIIGEFDQMQQEALRVQKDFYRMIQDARIIGVNDFNIRAKLKEQNVSRRMINNLMDGTFTPTNYSDARFKKREAAIEKQAQRLTKDDPYVGYVLRPGYAYPKLGLDMIKLQYDGRSLGEPAKKPQKIGGFWSTFPTGVPLNPTLWPQRIKNLINPFKGFGSPGDESKIQTPPLPKTSMPNVAPVAQTSPQTGLTRSETALLSPSEQEIARRT